MLIIIGHGVVLHDVSGTGGEPNAMLRIIRDMIVSKGHEAAVIGTVNKQFTSRRPKRCSCIPSDDNATYIIWARKAAVEGVYNVSAILITVFT